MEKPITVFNADDHPILRKGITNLICETEGLQWVGSAADGKEAIRKIAAIKPDIGLLDIEMPHYSGIEVVQQLREKGTSTRFILLTLFKDGGFIRSALEAGVAGYLLKEAGENEILDCIRAVNDGKQYISPALTGTILNINQPQDPLLASLTEHEKNILKLIARDKTTHQIADMLFISPKTVSNHRTNISKKLQLDGRQNALLKWVLEHKTLIGGS